MPGLVVGFLPMVVALGVGFSSLLIFGILFTCAAGGDLLVLWNLRKYPKNWRVKDHPEKIGFIVSE